ncbi:MAG: hypothetical protein JXD23_10765 [Spirochaetales bacterium]|nr:hypothetical protein [Spirochaetales bacterium]
MQNRVKRPVLATIAAIIVLCSFAIGLVSLSSAVSEFLKFAKLSSADASSKEALQSFINTLYSLGVSFSSLLCLGAGVLMLRNHRSGAIIARIRAISVFVFFGSIINALAILEFLPVFSPAAELKPEPSQFAIIGRQFSILQIPMAVAAFVIFTIGPVRRFFGLTKRA